MAWVEGENGMEWREDAPSVGVEERPGMVDGIGLTYQYVFPDGTAFATRTEAENYASRFGDERPEYQTLISPAPGYEAAFEARAQAGDAALRQFYDQKKTSLMGHIGNAAGVIAPFVAPVAGPALAGLYGGGVIGAAGAGATLGGANTALQGGDFGDIARSAVTGGLAGGAAGLAGQYLGGGSVVGDGINNGIDFSPNMYGDGVNNGVDFSPNLYGDGINNGVDFQLQPEGSSALQNLQESINTSNYGVNPSMPSAPVVERGITPAPSGSSGIPGVAKTAATSAGAASSLAKILDGTAGPADWLSVLGTAGSTALGIFGSKDAADSYRSLSEQSRNDRLPFLNKSLEWLNNPESFYSGPGKAGLDANLRALSATHGNPIGSPTALGIATEAGMRDWRNAVTGFGNIGLSGEDTRMQLGSNAIKADGGVYNALGSGLADLTTPKRSSLEDLLKSMGTKFSLA